MVYLKTPSAYQREIDKYHEYFSDVLRQHKENDVAADKTLQLLKLTLGVCRDNRELRQLAAEKLWNRLSAKHQARITLRALLGRCSKNEKRIFSAMSKRKLPDVLTTIWEKRLAVGIKIFVFRLVDANYVRREAIHRAITI